MSAAEEGKKVVLTMLAVGGVFLLVIAVGELSHHVGQARAAAANELAERLDQLGELVGAVALRPREADELARARDDGALLRRAGDVDPAPAPEVEQPLLAEKPERAEHGVRVHAEHRREVAGGR